MSLSIDRPAGCEGGEVMTPDERTVMSALELLDLGMANPTRTAAFNRIRAKLQAAERDIGLLRENWNAEVHRAEAAEAEVEQMQAALDANWVTHQRVVAAEEHAAGIDHLNDPSNLEVMTQAEHCRLHFTRKKKND